MAMPMAARKWTLEDLDRLPEDENRYELIDGELFVTPAPTDPHETAAARLTRILDPYVVEQGLGYVYHPRSVVQFEGSQVEPDLMVRQPNPHGDWSRAPVPVLVVEILSPSTRKLDLGKKRKYYLRHGVPEYWAVDPERRTITRIRPGMSDVIESEQLTWSPAGVNAPLSFALRDVFA